MAEMVIPLLAANRVAIVFGNEVNGLENRDLALCHELVAIPSSDEFSSLNLSHAVMIVAYELFLASSVHAGQAVAALARHDDMEAFYLHLQETLQTIGFFEYKDQGRMMFSFRQIFGRARLSSRDVRILRGVLSAAAGTAEKGEKSR
jgi:tRNA/rRNA methyltransferase